MNDLIRDLRQSFKALLRDKTFSATVLTTLAICLGANVAIYSVIHSVLLEPLPFPEPDRLVMVSNSYPGAGVPRASNGSADYFQRRENVPAFESVALFQGSGNTVGEAGSTERAVSVRVTPSFFPLLGIEAALGRTFTEDEMDIGNHQKVVLTHAYWQEHFGGAPDVVGRELRVDGQPFTVVGVLAEDFQMPDRPEARFFLPTAFSPEARGLDNWHSNNFEMVARLRPGATVEQAVAQNLALNDALIDQWSVPNARQLLADAGYTTLVMPAAEDMVRDVAPLLYMLWGGVVFVLLIGCVNIANLMLARAQTHSAETATKLALGAPRGRVARQVFTESVVLGLLGGGVGVAVGHVGLQLLRSIGTADLPRGTEIAIDAPVLVFTLALAVGAGALFGSIPMLQVMRGDLSPVFRVGGRTGTASRRAVWLRNGLVTSQVALAFVMLIGAGLMLLSFRAALSVDPGFEPEGVFTASVSLPSARYEDATARRQFWDELLAEVRAIPGIDAASVTTQLPFSGNNSSSIIFPEGHVMSPGESLLSPFQTVAGPGYFDAMGIEVLEGRVFLESDGPQDQRVIVLDEWLADRYWPGRSPLGDRMVAGAAPGQDSIPEENLFTVVGVVETIKQNDLTTPAAEHVGAYYFTYKQRTPAFVTLAAHSATGDATGLTPAVREVLGRLDAELPLFSVESMEQRIDSSLVRRRVPLVLLGVFAGVALFLSVVGLYGALAYTVAQRTREIGIRIAMGSAPQDVFQSVVRQGLGVTGLGLLLGAGGALLLTRVVQSLLFGVQATDPRVMIAVALLLAVVGLAACAIPARRATTVNPVEALLGN
jgi:predicted permease